MENERELTADELSLTKAVYNTALANWGSAGWDYIVECWTLVEIADELAQYEIDEAGAAIRHFGLIAQAWDEQRREIEGTAF